MNIDSSVSLHIAESLPIVMSSLTVMKHSWLITPMPLQKNPKWRFAGIYADEGITGTQANKRPNFQKMIRDCEKGKIDFILTKSVARFARNTVDSLRYVRKLKAMGIGVFFEEQALDSMKSGKRNVSRFV